MVYLVPVREGRRGGWCRLFSSNRLTSFNSSSVLDVLEGVNGVNRLAINGQKYNRLPTKREKNYRLPTGKILTDNRHGPTLWERF